MNIESMAVGVVSGLVSGFVLLVGSWALLLPKLPQMMRKEMVRDLRHYGRDLQRSGVTRIKDWMTTKRGS